MEKMKRQLKNVKVNKEKKENLIKERRRKVLQNK